MDKKAHEKLVAKLKLAKALQFQARHDVKLTDEQVRLLAEAIKKILRQNLQ